MSEEELIDMLYSKFCNENDDYDMRYTDIIYNSIEEKDKQLDKYKNVVDKIKEYCKEVIKEHNNGEYNVSTTQLAIQEHKGNIENILELLEEVE